MRTLVIGCGSIGQRHLRNLRCLGLNDLITYDPDKERARKVEEEQGVVVCNDLDEAFRREPRAVLVCTPPHLHVPVALRALEHNADLFIEKPLANSLDGVDQLLAEAERRNRVVCVGYNLRFHGGVMKLREMLDGGRIGKPLMIRAEVGQYLPDWRPSQDYRQGYMVRPDSGGGIILDASHELDYVCWIAGDVDRLFCMAGHLSSLEMNTEDAAVIVLRMRSGALAEVHLDCVQRTYTRQCKIIGESGTLLWDFNEGIRWISAGDEWRSIPVVPDANEMYIAEIRHFLSCVRREAVPVVDGKAGRRILEIALAAKESARSGQEIRL